MSRHKPDPNAPKWAAGVIMGGTVGAMFLMSLGMMLNKSVLTILGVVVIVGVLAVGVPLVNKQKAVNKANSQAAFTNSYGKYTPILMNESTKQNPDVQRLLQYPAVQKVFFDPSSLSTPSIMNDEYVRELLAVLDELYPSINGAVNGITNAAYQAPQIGTMPSEQKQIEEQYNKSHSTRRKVGSILMAIGILIFVLPFLFVFAKVGSTGSTGVPISEMGVFSVLFNAAPVGMILIIVGAVLKR